MKILVVDDHRMVNDSISEVLKKHQYIVDSVYDGEAAVEAISNFQYDCVVLDIMMPKLDGFEVVEKIRNLKIETPILFLSAKTSVDDKVKGLKLGGDDYLVKPFSMKELLARVEVLIRQKEKKQDLVYRAYDLELNASLNTVTQNNKTIELSQKEYAILLFLLRNKNRILSRDEILEHVWDFDADVASNIVDVYINYIRKKLDTSRHKIIETVYTRGYVIKDEEK